MPRVIEVERVLKANIDALKVEEDIHHVVFVSRLDWLAAAKTAAERLTWIRIEHFTVCELQFVLTQELWRYKLLRAPPLESDIYPGMWDTDAVARVFDARPGQVFVIDRPTGPYYRVVRASPSGRR